MMDDLIKRSDAIMQLSHNSQRGDDEWEMAVRSDMQIIRELRSAQSQAEIIYCKDCVKHNRGIGDYDELPDGTHHWYWKDETCPLVQYRGKAQGHEFDYQYCIYAKRRGTGK